MLSDHEFLARLQQSQLLSRAEIEAVERELSSSGIDQVLQRLLAEERCTGYQANILQGRTNDPLQLGAYLLLEEIGQGGMGRVFKARHRVMNRLVALKLIRPDLLTSADAVVRFRREVQAAARVAHPNIVMAHDAGEAEGSHFLVMEYCDGMTLSQLVRQRGPLAVGQACDYIRQAALGLQHASERGLVHRDIKPGNLMICGGQVKILDLGLARLHELAQADGESLMQTDSGVTMGTPDFVAPEQAKDPRTADIRADIYSLGCTLYYLLSGSVPFPGGTAFEKMLRHQTEQPKPLSTLRSNVPPEVLVILEQMMAKEPAGRFAAPAQVAEALLPLATSSAGVDADSSAETLLSSTLGSPVTGSNPSLASLPRRPAVAQRAAEDRLAEPISDAPTLRSDKDESLVALPAPRVVVAARAPIRASRRFLLIGGCVLSAVALLSGFAWVASRPWWPANQTASPYTATPATALEEWPLEKTFGPHAETVNALAFSHDDQILAVACGTEWGKTPGSVALWNVATGDSAGTLTGHQFDVLCVAMAPKPLAHVVATGEGKLNGAVPSEVRLWNIQNQTVLATIQGFKNGVVAVSFSNDGSLLATAGAQDDRTVRIWRVDRLLSARTAAVNETDAALVTSLTGLTKWIPTVAFSPDGKTLLAGSGDSVWRWQVEDWSELPRISLPRPAGDIHRAAWSRDGRRIAAVTNVAFIEPRPVPLIAVWNVDDSQEPPRFIDYDSSLGDVVFLADSRFLAVGDQDGYMALFNLATGQQVWRRKVSEDWAWANVLSHRGDFLAGKALEGSVSLWRVSK
jgi:serine/threonine-protein kinase